MPNNDRDIMSSADPELTDQSLKNRVRGFAAGVASGITKLAVGHPFDTVKIRLQTSSRSQFKGPLDCLLKTLRNEGPAALYKGATPPLIGWMFMDSIMLGTLHNTRMLLQNNWNGKDKPLTLFQHGLAGLAGGLTVSFVATPVEHIKARLQVQYNNKTKQYAGPVDCVRKVVRNNGILGLWQGLTPTMLFRSWFFVFWSSYEVFNRELTRRTNLDAGSISFIAGGGSATAFWLGAFPADMVKNRYMTQPDVTPRQFPTPTSVAKHVYRTEGLKGFYRGFLPSFLRAFPTNASAVFMFELVMRLLSDQNRLQGKKPL